MSDLKTRLIRLGKQQPELRPHLREVLSELDREAARVQVTSEVDALYRRFKESMDKCDSHHDKMDVGLLDSRHYRRTAGRPIVDMANTLFLGLSAHILEDREVPRKDLKKLERALAVIQKIRRSPNKPGTWWVKNKRHMEVIYNTRTYKTRDDADSSQSFELRGFEVFNTIQAQGQEMDEVRDIIERGVDAMKRSGVPVVPKLLYGKLKIVGKIRQSDTLAWYNQVSDDVSVRTRISKELDAVHSLIHELGHRWWQRFLDRDIQRRWTRHHNRLGIKPSDYPMPDVGDPLGFPVRGVGDNPIVREIRGPQGRRMFFLEGSSGYIQEKNIRKVFKRKNFPTLYAASDVQEHFCESFAMYCLGTLNQDHRDAFEEIVLGKEPAYDTPVPVVEESPEPMPEDKAPGFGWDENESRALMAALYGAISKEKDVLNSLDILEAGSQAEGVSALGMNLSFEIETTDGTVPYELTVTLDLDKESMTLDADPRPFDYSIDSKKVDVASMDSDDLSRYVLRLLRDYEEGLVDMVSPDAKIVTRPKPSSKEKPGTMSKDNAKRLLEDIVKVLGKLKSIEHARKPEFEGEGVQTKIRFSFETSTGNTPYELTLDVTGNTLTANAEPKVFDGNIENKTLQLNPSRSSDDVAKAIARLLTEYEYGLEDMVNGF